MPGGFEGFEGLEWHQGAESAVQNGDWLQDKKNELVRTEKTGLFGGPKENSAKFSSVTKALDNLNDVLDMSFGDNEEVWQTALRLVFKGYEVLLQACDGYLQNDKGKMRSAVSSVGKQRLQIISSIRSNAVSDMENLMVQRFENPENLGSQRNVRDMLSKARTRKLQLNRKDSEHGHAGGALSVLTKLDADETGDRAGFFKPETTLYRDANQNCEVIINLAAEYSGISREKLMQARAVLGKFDGEWDIKFNSLKGNWIVKLKKSPLYQDPEVKAFADRLDSLASGTDNSVQNMLVSEGMLHIQADSLNISGRNVATSRMASMMGIGNLIAKSERVEAIEPGKENGRVGNLMDKADGTEAKELIGQYIISELGNSDKKYRDGDIGAMVAGKMSGSFQKDLSNLQVFDYICGQIDRHFENFFIQTDANEQFSGVTGIDNDLSFGQATLNSSGLYGQYGSKVVGENGELAIQHMSKEFAVSILSLPEQSVRFALADLIEQPEIEACCNRLRALKTALQKEMAKKPEDSRLRSDQEWGDTTLQAFLNEEGGKWGKGEKNYIGRLATQFSTDFFYGDQLKAAQAMQKERGIV